MNNKSAQQVLENQIGNYEKLLALAKDIFKALENDGSQAQLTSLLEERATTFSIIKKRDEELKQFSADDSIDEPVITKLRKSMEALLAEDKKIAGIVAEIEGGIKSELGSMNLVGSAMQGYLSQNYKEGFGRFINLKN